MCERCSTIVGNCKHFKCRAKNCRTVSFKCPGCRGHLHSANGRMSLPAAKIVQFMSSPPPSDDRKTCQSCQSSVGRESMQRCQSGHHVCKPCTSRAASFMPRCPLCRALASAVGANDDSWFECIAGDSGECRYAPEPVTKADYGRHLRKQHGEGVSESSLRPSRKAMHGFSVRCDPACLPHKFSACSWGHPHFRVQSFRGRDVLLLPHWRVDRGRSVKCYVSLAMATSAADAACFGAIVNIRTSGEEAAESLSSEPIIPLSSLYDRTSDHLRSWNGVEMEAAIVPNEKGDCYHVQFSLRLVELSKPEKLEVDEVSDEDVPDAGCYWQSRKGLAPPDWGPRL